MVPTRVNSPVPYPGKIPEGINPTWEAARRQSTKGANATRGNGVNAPSHFQSQAPGKPSTLKESSMVEGGWVFKHNSCGQMQARGLSQNVRRIYYYQNSTCCMVYSNPFLQMIIWTQGLPITTNPYIWQDRYCRYMQVQGQCIFHTRSTIVQVQLPSQNIAISISSQPIIIGLAMILDQEWET